MGFKRWETVPSGRGYPAMAGARLRRRRCGEPQVDMGVVSTIRSPVVGLEEREPAFFQDADRGGVVLRDPAWSGRIGSSPRKTKSASVATPRPQKARSTGNGEYIRW